MTSMNRKSRVQLDAQEDEASTSPEFDSQQSRFISDSVS
jgi:hypothetical protein